MRILVCGGRDFTDELLVSNTLGKVISDAGNVSYLYDGSVDVKNTIIIQGGAKGADALAKSVAIFYNIPCLEFPAKWEIYGNRAGPLRNIQMLEEGKPDLVIAFPGGKGTAHMVKIAKEAGIEVIEVNKENKI